MIVAALPEQRKELEVEIDTVTSLTFKAIVEIGDAHPLDKAVKLYTPELLARVFDIVGF